MEELYIKNNNPLGKAVMIIKIIAAFCFIIYVLIIELQCNEINLTKT